MLMAHGVTEVIPHQLFPARISSFGDEPVHLPKHSTLGIALPSPMTIGLASLGVAGSKKKGYRMGVEEILTRIVQRSGGMKSVSV